MAIRVPRFKPNFHVTSVPGQGTFLLTEVVPSVLSGEIYEAVCPLIDGTRSADEIAAELKGTVQPAEVYYALGLLEKRGYLESAEAATEPGTAAFWLSLGQDPADVVPRLEANPVRLVTLGAVDRQAAEAALTSAGLTLSDAGGTTVVMTDDYRYPEIDDIDAKMLANEQRWALVKPTGVYPWIGPFFSPDAPGCWRCLLDRINMNYMADTFVLEQAKTTPVTALSYNPAAVATVMNLAAVELAKWIGTGSTELVNTILSLSLGSLNTEQHTVVHRPQCRRCGEEDYRQRRTKFRDPQPIELQSRPHLHSADGGHRTASAEETLHRYQHLVSPITGVVSRLQSVSRDDHPVIHAYSASHNWATHPDSLSFMRHTLRSQSGGKGTSEIQAKVGAMAEAFERYSGVFRADEIRKRATMAELAAEGLEYVHPHDITTFSDAQYARRKEINAEGNSFQIVPEPYDESLPADWSPMWAPTRNTFVWVPTGLLYYSYNKLAPHDTPNRLAYYADSNGCAAGNTREEAALQALLELVERDAVATWWYNQVRRPQVNLDDLESPYLADLREWLDAQGRDLWVLDITNDIGIPVFAAVSLLREPRANGSENIVIGFGAHVEPRVGIMRAVTEVNQFFASLFALGEDDLATAFDPGAVQWWNEANTEEKAYLLPAEGMAPEPLSAIPDFTSDDLLTELQTVIEKIEARGLEVLLLDQTRPDVNFPVIKAIVPGMRHFWARLGPGRLYDVPVELGWLDSPTAEAELNKTPVFF